MMKYYIKINQPQMNLEKLNKISYNQDKLLINKVNL